MHCGRCSGDHSYWNCPYVKEDKRVEEHNQIFRIEQKLEEIAELLKIQLTLNK